MKITIFTSNSKRHLSLINKLSKISDECNAVVEVKTLFHGEKKDFFSKSKIMKKYFKNVNNAENKFFKNENYIKKPVKIKMIKQGDLNFLKKNDIKFALKSDIYIVFGASYIKTKWLINFLIRNKTINIHMGISPFYRGSSCNFWAFYDNNPEYVGATIHYLSKGLDSGKIIAHCLPNYKEKNYFDYTMSSVVSAHKCLINLIKSKKLFKLNSVIQNNKLQLRYSKNIEFNDGILKKFLSRKDIHKISKIDTIAIKKKLINSYNF